MQVLIVEDSARDAGLIERELKKHFDAVAMTRVETLEAFSAALRGGDWDVVICDHLLPRFSSTEAMAALRESGLDIPLLVVSGTMGEDFAVAAMRGGARDYLVKRDLHRLAPAVERELRDASLRRNLAASERERARQEAERSLLQGQLEIIRRFGNDILLLLALDGAIVQANDRAIVAYGYAEDELLRLNVRDLRATETRSDVEARIGHALTESGARFTTIHRRRDGSTFPVEVSTRALEIGGKRFVQSIIRDLTEERAARGAIDYQAMLLDNLYDAVIGLDADKRINVWNRAAERMLGWSAAETLGHGVDEFPASEYADGATLAEKMSLASLTGPIRSDVRRRTRSGNWVDVESTAVALRGPDHRLLGFVSVNRDVSVRKRAQAALRASEARLNRILEATNEGICVIDAQGRTEFANARAGQMFGFEPGEAIGRNLLECVPEDARPTLQVDLASLLHGDAVQRELELRGPDGSESHVVLSGSVLRDPAGKVEGAVASFMDVGALHRAREQLLHSQKMEAVGRLASGIAHDFNNLLVVILSNTSFLLEALPEGESRTDAQGIRDAGHRAASLVRQLLAFGRKTVANPVPTDLTGVVQGIEKLLRPTIGEDVVVSLSLAPRKWPIHIDPGHLEQVVMNLAVNARDAMPDGGELSIETRYESIDRPPEGCRDLAPGRYAVLQITDTGCGMTPEVLSRIFEPFFTTKERGKGTGLGLATVYGIVEQANGRIAVASKAGQGTAFTVYLPACDAPDPVEAARQDPPRARGRGQKILLVEDEDGVRHVVRKMLERNGFSVVEASSGNEAYRTLAEHGPVDLVLSDAVMPAGSGEGLAAMVGKTHPRVPVVLMSGYSDRQRSPEAATGSLLVKPFTENALLERLRAEFDRAAGGSRSPE